MSDIIDTFIHITDLHFWEVVRNPLLLLNKRIMGNTNVYLKRRHEFDMERARPYLDHAASLGIGELICTGDFASTSTEGEFARGAEWMRYAESKGFHCTAIPGNHDVYTFASVRGKRFEHHYNEWLPGPDLPCIQSLPGGTPVLYVPTVCANWFSSQGRISHDEVQRTAELLQPLEGPVVVAGHYPLLNKTCNYIVNPNRQLRNAEALRRILGESGKTILYCCGHVHRFNFEHDPDYGNVTHLTTGAFFRTAHESDSEGEFSEVRIVRNGFKVVRHVKRTEWETHSASETMSP
ncbi:MAG: hypothetical protein COA73_11175 [Candidatus Hydrogenedentota bacterium]|nr:MAG: hypothetical protein COA73_11175 [Candidatus Hydrogenedentota bacterium]